MPRLDGQEGEQVVEVEALLEDLRQREQHPLDQVAALAEGAREEGEHADGEEAGRRPVADHGEIDDHRVGAVVAQRADRREQARDQAPTDRERLVGLVELLGEPVVAAHQEVGQPEELELLGRDVAGGDVAQVVELAPLGRPGVEQRIAQRGEVGLAQQRRQHRHDQQHQQPGDVHRQRHGQRRPG